jgi:hypothetical protein
MEKQYYQQIQNILINKQIKIHKGSQQSQTQREEKKERKKREREDKKIQSHLTSSSS